MNEARNLEAKIAVVTGAAQGLGKEIARQLATEGAYVILADLQIEKARGAAGELTSEGLVVGVHGLDVTNSAQVDDLFDSIAKERGAIDILINSAGLGQDVCHTVELSNDDWDRVISVNLTGTFHTCRAAGRLMRERESGAIVNLASINGQNPAALVAAYNASKAAVISLTKTLALELAPYNVRVNAVSPGPVYTDFNKKVMTQRAKGLGVAEEGMIERVRKAVPLGRWGEPGDIAGAVTFLCEERASWITGEVLTVSGGLTGVSAAPTKQKCD
ncbi:MAG: 3-oxoacyl-ACP reductase [Solibacterales bacterium]|nr:3-oxoacyl-ACP reductase [Bryobacterales bacterium]|tara:strand:+ start:9800 stop:10621 length:822 start_codon:yes stop_codon:yes gene_type:complete